MIHEVNLRTRLLVANDAALPVPAVLRYDPADPYAIHATFTAGEGEILWYFARDVLAAGLKGDAGIGDVRAWTKTDSGFKVLYLSLSSPEGEALLELPYEEVSKFLQFTYSMVEIGTENMIDDQFDSDLDDILSNGF